MKGLLARLYLSCSVLSNITLAVMAVGISAFLLSLSVLFPRLSLPCPSCASLSPLIPGVADGCCFWFFRFAVAVLVDDESEEDRIAEADDRLLPLESFSEAVDEEGGRVEGIRISLSDNVEVWSTVSRSSESCDERI